MANNLQKIFEEREAMLPPELETRMTQHIGAFCVFGKVVELFMPNALQTMVRLMGGEEMAFDQHHQATPCDPDWRTPPPAGPVV